MTDFSAADDEIISSYLDAEATPDEVAKVENDPVMRARAAELRAAAQLVATPVRPLPADAAERLIGTALAESTTSETVTDIATARPRRFRQALVSGAAAVLVAAVAVPALLALNRATDSSSSNADTTAELDGDDEGLADASDEGRDGQDDSGDDGGATADSLAFEADMAAADSVEAAPPVAGDTDDTAGEALAPTVTRFELLPDDLGPFADTAGLSAAIAELWAARAPEGFVQAPSDPGRSFYGELPCGPELVEHLDRLEILVDLAVVDVDGVSTTVIIADIGDGGALLAVAEPASCGVRELAELPRP